MPLRQLISSDESIQCTEQHTKPCSDCPFARTALRGWLGSLSVEDWLSNAHGESRVQCHVISNQQCAGLAIYRTNVAKKPRDLGTLILPADREKVFATPTEFILHHRKFTATA